VLQAPRPRLAASAGGDSCHVVGVLQTAASTYCVFSAIIQEQCPCCTCSCFAGLLAAPSRLNGVLPLLSPGELQAGRAFKRLAASRYGLHGCFRPSC